jgi:hypothetical protein
MALKTSSFLPLQLFKFSPDCCTDYNEAVKKALNAKSPSESAKSKEYKTYQHKSPIYDGRYDATKPIDTTAPPIQLFHPVFGHFLDDLSKDLCVPPEIVKATVGYMRASSAMYDNEAIRRATLEPHLGRILGNGMGTVVNPDGTWPDGAFSITLTNEICESAVTLIKEEKNNIGDGGSDPSTQVGLSMARFWAQDQVDQCDFYLLLSALTLLFYQHSGVRNNTCCPTFLLATAGPWFTILGGIFTDKWIVQRLTDFIWVGLDATLKEPHYNRVAHILYSLRRNVEKLRDYYVGLKVIASDTEDLHPRFFPSICTYRDEEDIFINFKYIKPLEFDSTCVTFLSKDDVGYPEGGCGQIRPALWGRSTSLTRKRIPGAATLLSREDWCSSRRSLIWSSSNGCDGVHRRRDFGSSEANSANFHGSSPACSGCLA